MFNSLNIYSLFEVMTGEWDESCELIRGCSRVTPLHRDLPGVPQGRTQFVPNCIVAFTEMEPPDLPPGDHECGAQFVMKTLQIGHGR